MKKNVLLLITISILLFGCMSLSYYDEVIDYNGIRIGKRDVQDLENPHTSYTYQYHGFIGGLMDNVGTIDYKLDYFKFQNENSFYNLFFKLDAENWVFHDGLVKIEVDGNLYKFKDDNPSRNVISGTWISEIISIPVNEEFIQSIKNSNTVKIQFYKDPFTLKPEELNNLKIFIEFTKQL